MPRNRRSIVLDPAAVDEACAWIEALVPETALDRSDLGASLSDGRVLCALVNAISPGAIRKISTMDSKFKRMDNITAFLRAAKKLGLPAKDCFDTIDLAEGKDLVAVVQCIHAFGRSVQATLPDGNRPMLGPRLATENRRTFSETQLRAGLNELTFQTRGANIERLGVDESASITFGNQKAGTGDTSESTFQTRGANIERLGVDESASITFGYKKSGGPDVDAPPADDVDGDAAPPPPKRLPRPPTKERPAAPPSPETALPLESAPAEDSPGDSEPEVDLEPLPSLFLFDPPPPPVPHTYSPDQAAGS